ncbi:dihydroorotase [Suttonella ornithocola]|uniref:Dihydroorotase n=1 Tax=Suttonella ornithocola TaxID=279832 RepID=A0A380MLV8_9GAMM|nr:dihydroorotase [Suttonella ornithocola]SUO93154.1 Dihydroorotase [Suttonella ornithocola]
MQEVITPLFDDMHVHFRDGAALARTVADTSAYCARALVMPNLVPALDTLDAVRDYCERILAHVPKGRAFTPLMSLYLSENLRAEALADARAVGVKAVKWYPKGATTNSAQGVGSVEKIYPILATMEKVGLLLLIHGEVTDDGIDIFDRESHFVDNVLIPLRKQFPHLKMVLEHITTAHAADYVLSEHQNLAATITPQHLLFNRNQLLVGGIKPHYYCLPILKTEADRKRLVEVATSGDSRFFLGTDSAPHLQHAKENACGCAGCYSAYHAPSLYAEVFERANALDKLADFACGFGADYYELPRNTEVIGKLRLYKQSHQIAESLSYSGEALIPLEAGKEWQWQFERIDA